MLIKVIGHAVKLKHAARQKMPMASFALATDAKGNLQPTIHVYKKD